MKTQIKTKSIIKAIKKFSKKRVSKLKKISIIRIIAVCMLTIISTITISYADFNTVKTKIQNMVLTDS
jgi:hypothetical protein